MSFLQELLKYQKYNGLNVEQIGKNVVSGEDNSHLYKVFSGYCASVLCAHSDWCDVMLANFCP